MLSPWVVTSLLLAGAPCDGDQIRLDWVRAAQARACPDGAAVAARVRAELGCDPFGADPQLRFEVAVDAAAPGWVATVRRLDETGANVGETELSSRAQACAVIVDAVSLAISLVAGPRARAAPEVMALAETSTAVITRKVIVVPPPPAPPPPPPPPGISVTGALAANLGTLAGLAPGATVEVRWRLARHFAIGADLLVLPTQRFGAYGFGLVALGASACARWPLGRWTLDGCGRGYLGDLSTVVYPGAAPIDPGPYLWAAVSAGASTRFALTRHLFLLVELEALAALPRRAFRTRPDLVEVHREAAVSLNGKLGLGVHFGE